MNGPIDGAMGPAARPVAERPILRSLRWMATAVLLGAVALRCLSVQIAQSVFDVDPLMALAPQSGLVPGWSLLLDALLIAIALVGLGAEALTGRRVRWWLVALVVAPLPALLGHGGERMEHLWRGGAWMTGLLGAVALAHLARDRELRLLSLGVLLGVVAAMVVRGAVQLAIEHPDTVRAFERTRAQFLAERGWTADSPAARVYEERLRQPEASGWFGLANVFSTFMAAGGLLAAGVALGAWRRRSPKETPSGWTGAMALLALACAGLLAINGSKGALGAAAIGMAIFVVAARAIARDRVPPRSFPIWFAVGLAATIVAAVVVRGGLLPEGLAHERSLLFRWHYLVDAAKVIAGNPLRGVGPDGFQQAMVLVRSPRHPEEVASVHNAALDWLTSFGVLGVAWIVAATALAAGTAEAALAARASGAPAMPSTPPLESPTPSRRSAAPSRTSSTRPRIDADARAPGAATARAAVLVVLAASVVGLALEAGSLDPLLLVMRLVGAGVACALAWVAVRTIALVDGGAMMRAGLFAAACVVVVHVQIEMTLWLAGGAGWCLALLGVAAAGDAPLPAFARRAKGGAIVAIAAAAALALAAACFVFTGVHLVQDEHAMIAAVQPIVAVGRARVAARAVAGSLATTAAVAGAGPAVGADALRASTRVGAPLEAFEDALRDAGVPQATIASVVKRLASANRDERETGLRTADEAMRETEDAARLAAIDALSRVGIDGRLAPNLLPTLAVADEALRAGSTLEPAQRREMLNGARSTIAYVLADHPDDLRLLRSRAELDEAIALVSGTKPDWIAALASWQAVAQGDPQAIAPRRRVAEAAKRCDEPAVAADALRRVLEIDAQLVLDPRKRLGDAERAAILHELSSSRDATP